MLLGTSHEGLSITPTAIADSCGVGVLIAPAIARCFHRLTPFSTRVAWKPGTLTMMYFWPRSRGSQRQRSRLSRMRLILAVSVAGVISSADLSAAYCGWVGSRPFSARGDPMRGERAPQQVVLLRRVEVWVDDEPVDPRADFFTWPSARSEETRLKRSVASFDSEQRIAAGASRRSARPGHNRRG